MKKIFLTLIIFYLAICPAKAGTISYKSLLDKAIKNSYDLKMSQIDIKVTQAEIKEARAQYYPVLSMGYSAQFDKDLTKGTSSMTPVGDSVVVNATRYVNSFNLGLQYNLYDFGVRKQNLNIAKKDKIQKQSSYNKNLRDLKLELSDVYTKALLSKKELVKNEELLKLNKVLFGMYDSLYNSGTIRKTELTNQALNVAVTVNRIDDLKTQLNNTLKDLSYYTKENYSPADIMLCLFEEEEKTLPVSNKSMIKLELTENELLKKENIPEYKQYQMEIEKKKAELSILKRQNLPEFKFNTFYYLYGTDDDKFFSSYSDIKNRSLTFRLTSTLPIFDGFKNAAQREKKKLEIERLLIERDKKVESIVSLYEKSYEEVKASNEKIKNQQTTLELTEEKMAMLEKLNQQKLIDKISYLKQKADLISQKFELEKTKINSEEAAYKWRIIAETPEPPESDKILRKNNNSKLKGNK